MTVAAAGVVRTPTASERQHTLRFRRSLPERRETTLPSGSQRDWAIEATADGCSLRWTGAALMGVLNVTTDSFSDGGRFADAAGAIQAGVALHDEGALWVDVGGESTRPGSAGVSAAEERERVLPVIAGLAERGVWVSVDTLKPEVADAALAVGAVLVNDVGGLRDPAMRRVCAAAGAPAIAMHMQGEPRTMQRAPRYRDVVAEVEAFLLERSAEAKADGVPDVLVDPGIGFGKDDAHNLALLRACTRLSGWGIPLVIGVSRKSMIGRLTGESDPAARLPGSLALGLYAADHGAAVLRVHDVGPHRQALRARRALRLEEGHVG